MQTRKQERQELREGERDEEEGEKQTNKRNKKEYRIILHFLPAQRFVNCICMLSPSP